MGVQKVGENIGCQYFSNKFFDGLLTACLQNLDVRHFEKNNIRVTLANSGTGITSAWC